MTQVNTITKSHKGTHLTYAEMKQIEAYKKIELSHREIGRLLERSPQTINDNVKKGTVLQVNKQIQNGKAYFYEKEVYFADVNFRVYEENRENCGRRPKWIDGTKFIEWADKKMLEEKWSPDVVVNKAREENLYHESILPSTSIEHRPKSVEERLEFGHWEIDTVIGRKCADDPVLLTLVERKTTFELLFKLDGKQSECVDHTLRTFMNQLSGIEGKIFKTNTADNGSEFSNLSELSQSIDVYFCYPFASYERGTSENQHKIIRRFLPKHQSFKDVTQSQVKRIQQWMNDYPRRNHNYKTPHQVFALELQKLKLDLVA